jgi:HAT1-interacting factor 1
MRRYVIVHSPARSLTDSSPQDAEEEGEEGEEEQDDLALAFEILDMARVLYLKRLEAEQAEAQPEEAGNGENAPKGGPPAVRHIKERLGDTHDLLAEISLENEKYLRPHVS